MTALPLPEYFSPLKELVLPLGFEESVLRAGIGRNISGDYFDDASVTRVHNTRALAHRGEGEVRVGPRLGPTETAYASWILNVDGSGEGFFVNEKKRRKTRLGVEKRYRGSQEVGLTFTSPTSLHQPTRYPAAPERPMAEATISAPVRWRSSPFATRWSSSITSGRIEFQYRVVRYQMTISRAATAATVTGSA